MVSQGTSQRYEDSLAAPLPARESARSPEEQVLGAHAPAEIPEYAEEPQFPCPHCGRTFREKVLARHVGKCVKINRDRKVFDAVAHAIPQEAMKAKVSSEKA